jgi:CrcB protein
MTIYLLAAQGSAIGGMARYGVGILAVNLWGTAFPWGTLIINVLGSFVIAFFGTLTLASGTMPAGPALRTFVMVGFCGARLNMLAGCAAGDEASSGPRWLSRYVAVSRSMLLSLTKEGGLVSCRHCPADGPTSSRCASGLLARALPYNNVPGTLCAPDGRSSDDHGDMAALACGTA